MEEEYVYPTMPVEVLIKMIKKSERFDGEIKVGSTTTLVLKGKKYIGKRSLSFRDDIPEIDYDQAMGIAILAKVLPSAMDWLEENRNFKEGGYIVPPDETPPGDE
jgi:hypothetical protein